MLQDITPMLGKRILVITAHPDDESYTIAGLARANAEAGGKNWLVCATYGERGSSHLAEPVSAQELLSIRRDELAAASRFLRFEKTICPALPDGEVREHARTLWEICESASRRFQPELIFSFGQDGISGHLDHIAAGSVARGLARDLGIPFIAFALPPALVRNSEAWLTARRKAGWYAKALEYAEANAYLSVSPRLKRQALSHHRSQLDLGKPYSGFPPEVARELERGEYFVIAS